MAVIAGVEILRVGVWNDRRFTVRHLDDMVAAAKKIGFRPPVKLGHVETPDAPAWGYAVNLRRVGDVLLADLVDVPDELVTMIRAARYDSVSCEVWFDLDRDGTKYPVALKAVAVIGAHPPAVSHLRPLRSALEAA